jgi:mannosyl-3-phosphoglycerate phosphatase
MTITQDRLLVVSDLDGTLLERTTYSFHQAREALDALEARHIPLILATSKTLAEVRELAAAIGGEPILIVENGGAAVIPAFHAPALLPEAATRDGDALVIEMGVARDVLVRELAHIAVETGAALRGFNQMSAADVSALTGLPLDASRLALLRSYDEPFLVERDDQLPAIAEAAHRRGLSVTQGGRFHHLTGPSDKGTALAEVLRAFARGGHQFFTVGLGDAPNDLPFLRQVDRPIVVPQSGRDVDPQLAAALPHAERAPDEGPRGWNLAMLAILGGQRLAPVGRVLV